MTKSEARAQGKAVRQALTAGERAARDRKILERCRQELPWERYRRVHLYLPIKRQHEINIWLLLPWIWQTYPRIQLFTPRLAAGTMEQVAIDKDTTYRVNTMGIPEPSGGEVADADARFDLVLVPLLAFDQAGHRVGYGGGHYDRFLAGQTAAHRVGLAYEACLIEPGIEAESHDVPLHLIITDEGVRRTAP